VSELTADLITRTSRWQLYVQSCVTGCFQDTEVSHTVASWTCLEVGQHRPVYNKDDTTSHELLRRDTLFPQLLSSAAINLCVATNPRNHRARHKTWCSVTCMWSTTAKVRRAKDVHVRQMMLRRHATKDPSVTMTRWLLTAIRRIPQCCQLMTSPMTGHLMRTVDAMKPNMIGLIHSQLRTILSPAQHQKPVKPETWAADEGAVCRLLLLTGKQIHV